MIGKGRLLSTLFFPLLIVSISILSSCTKIQTQHTPLTQTGLASWYGEENQGLPTSSREIYDMHDLTAASKTLPFGTIVRVINLRNHKEVVVRINDRGPFVEGRIIDLSFAAAKALEMTEIGVVPVKLEILNRRTPDELRINYGVQAGSFVEISHAQDLCRLLTKSFRNVMLTCFETPGTKYYRVRIRCDSQEQAIQIRDRLKSEGYSAYIVELSPKQ
jgi:rare lipoprotein A